jgi:hypothetical protein
MGTPRNPKAWRRFGLAATITTGLSLVAASIYGMTDLDARLASAHRERTDQVLIEYRGGEGSVKRDCPWDERREAPAQLDRQRL